MATIRLASRRTPPSPAQEQSIGHTMRELGGPFGPTIVGGGGGSQNVLNQIRDGHDAYQKSFHRHLPPSTFISERDRLRLNQAMPLSERLIEDQAAERQLRKDLDQL